MALPIVISRNQVNVIPDKSASGNPNTIGTTPFVLYTVPTGFKTLLKAFLYRPTGFGAGTKMQPVVAGSNLRDDSSTSTVMFDCLSGATLLLNASETITLKGDSGSNNESAFWFITFQELPA